MHKKFLNLAKNSFINLPDGAGLLWQARMERQKLPELVTTISYSMNLIRLAQAKGYTVFLVGSKDEVLEKLVSNLKRSFPYLRIVGKHHGYFKGASKQRVLDALRKTDPHIIFLGIGYHRGMKWLAENHARLGNCILVNMAAELDVLAGKRKKAPDFIVTRSYTWLWRCLNRPWRWHRLLLVFYWFFTTLLRRLFIRKKTQ